MRKPMSRLLVQAACILGLTLAFDAMGAARGQQGTAPAPPTGPAPTVNAVEASEAIALSFRLPLDRAMGAPDHPPIDTIPPMPMRMPHDGPSLAPAAAGPNVPVAYDASTRQSVEVPQLAQALSDAAAQGGGYSGADGGPEVMRPAMMSGGFMTLQSDATAASHPFRMNVKMVMRFGASYFVCSGTMRDAEVALTAGHCVFDFGGAGWADEIWIYPGWDGVGTINPGPSTTMQPYGWARGTLFGSLTGWTNNGDFDSDLGAVVVTRAVGFLTGWFGWAWGGDCGFRLGQTWHNASYPAEGCGTPGLHNGRDMYYWFGSFDSCPWIFFPFTLSNRLRLNTNSGCTGAIWGGQSGSGAYYIDGSNRYVHAVTSTSNRVSEADYVRQTETWVNFTDATLIDANARGGTFDLQPLDVNASPTPIVAGTSTNLLNHLAVNSTNAAGSGNWTFRVYLSTNDDISSGDTLLSTQSYNWNFGAMGSVTVNMAMVTIPANTPPGNYWIGVIYDAATDFDSGNNDTDGWDATPITVQNVDLDITFVSAPASAEPGDAIVVSNTVQNIGNAASPAFDVGLYLSNDSVCTTSDTFLGFRSVGGLGAGLSSNANTGVTIPAGATLGTHYVCAIADDLSAVPESNEGNNTGSDAIAIVRADLTVSAVTAPAVASPGSGISVSNTVGNAGTGSAGAFTVGIYLSTDNVCTTGDTLLATRAVAGLGAGLASLANTPVTIPAATPFSSRFICVIADTANAVVESSEANNSASRAISIVSSTPTVNLKVNGIDAATVNSTGPVLLTLDIAASTVTTPVDWYWALVYNGSVFWVTAGGLSSTPAPLLTAVPGALTDAPLLNLTLPAGSSLTNAFFLVSGGAVLSSDFTTVNIVTTSAPADQRQ